MIDAPLLIVAPPGAHASRLAAMLGQHPRAQDLPELSLFMARTVGELGEIGTAGPLTHDFGQLLRI